MSLFLDDESGFEAEAPELVTLPQTVTERRMTAARITKCRMTEG
jgi:hypothetical protein